MNVYAVVSELIDPGTSAADIEPADVYCIAAVVRARSRSQARYLAARADGGWAVMPWDGIRYAVRLLQRDVPGEPAVVSDEAEFQGLWMDPRWPDPPGFPPPPGAEVV